MTQAIYEGSKITARATIVDGDPGATQIEFIFRKNDTEELKKVETVLAGNKAETTFFAPMIADDETHFKLAYDFKYKNNTGGFSTEKNVADFTVWPQTVTVTAKNHEDKAPLPGFCFKVLQNGSPTAVQHTNDKGTLKVGLKPGSEFKVVPLSPYAITNKTDFDQQKGTARNIEGECRFKVKILDLATKKKIKQFVNLDTASEGRDGLGNEVIVEVEIDNDPTGKAKANAKGLVVYIRATFGPKGAHAWDSKSPRDDPKAKTELVDSGLKTRVEVTAREEYRAEVELDDQGKARFKVALGLAGGDTCKVEVSGTDTFLTEPFSGPDDWVEFENWRRLFYEMMAPDCMELEDHTLSDSSVIKDFPQQARVEFKKVGQEIFLEYAPAACLVYEKSKAVAGTILPGSFLEMSDRPEVFVLTYSTCMKDPTGIVFPNKYPDKMVKLKLCEATYCYRSADGTKRLSDTTETDEVTFNTVGNFFFFPVSGADNTQSGLASLKWKAHIAPNNYKTVVDDPTNVRTNPPADEKDVASRTITITETNSGDSHDIVYHNPKVGHIPTKLKDDVKTVLGQWIENRFDPAKLRAHGNKVSLEITADQGNSRRDTRFTNVEDYIKEKLRTLKGTHRIPLHPALDNAGQPKEGTLTVNDVDMTKSTYRKIVVKLPGTPAGLAGPASATHCPIDVDIEYLQQRRLGGFSGMGLSINIFQKRYATTHTHVLFHELSHAYGMNNVLDDNQFAPGLKRCKKVDENDPDFGDPGSKGNFYDGHGGYGPHCAAGIADTEKIKPEPHPFAGGKCIMFGSGYPDTPTSWASGFCNQCKVYIRARDMSRLTKDPYS